MVKQILLFPLNWISLRKKEKTNYQCKNHNFSRRSWIDVKKKKKCIEKYSEQDEKKLTKIKDYQKITVIVIQ